MTKKIPVKNLYLIAIISIGLIGLAVGSTYAMFTATAEINNPISLSSNLTYTSDIVETMDVTVAPGETEYVVLDVTNSTDSTLNYAIWYIDEGYDIDFGTDLETPDDTTSGSLSTGSYFPIGVYIRNNGTSNATVTLGISSSSGNIVLADNMTILPSSGLPVPKNLLKRIEYLYTNATKTKVTNNSITYNYATSVNLMQDTQGNIRYYGASPYNYIYFNCDAYPSTNCELWRIIGIVDGKVKLIRNESIGDYSWDTSSSGINSGWGINEWSKADLMKLLNPGYESNTDLNNSGTSITVNNSLYYNSGSGTCYSGYTNATTTCDFTSTGIKNDITRSMISDSTWYLGGGSSISIYSNDSLTMERGTNVVIPGTTCSGTSCNDTVTRTTSWTGKIGLMYPSDYGYATDFTKCSQNLYNYYSSTNSYACVSNDWLYNSATQWLLTPDSSDASSAWYVDSYGDVYRNSVSTVKVVRPVLNLNSELVIESGSGTESDPYRISA